MNYLKVLVEKAEQLIRQEEKCLMLEEKQNKVPEEEQRKLDQMDFNFAELVKGYMKEHENFKEEVIEAIKDEDILNEIEVAYLKSISFYQDDKGWSRLFFIPIVYAKNKGIGFDENRTEWREQIKDVLGGVLEQEGLNLNDITISVYSEVLKNWTHHDEEVHSFMDLHEHLIKGKTLNIDYSFPRLRMSQENEDINHMLEFGVLPVAIGHANRDWLEDLHLEFVKDKIAKELDVVLAAPQHVYWSGPVDPMDLQDVKTLMFWDIQTRYVLGKALKSNQSSVAVKVTGYLENTELMVVEMSITTGEGTKEANIKRLALPKEGMGDVLQSVYAFELFNSPRVKLKVEFMDIALLMDED